MRAAPRRAAPVDVRQHLQPRRPAALGALLAACAPKLAWLDIEALFSGRTRGQAIDHAAWLLPLRSCAALRVALLPNQR